MTHPANQPRRVTAPAGVDPSSISTFRPRGLGPDDRRALIDRAAKFSAKGFRAEAIARILNVSLGYAESLMKGQG